MTGQRPAEVGLFTPTTTRERARSLAQAYDLLWNAATEAQRERIRPHRLAWDAYYRRLLDSWTTAVLDTGEVTAHEAQFERLRAMVEAAGRNVSAVPAIHAPASPLQPLTAASQEASRGLTVLGVGMGLIGAVLLIRASTKG